MRSRFYILVFLIAAGGLMRVPAASIELRPKADTTLIEISPNNNMGAQTFVNSGTTQVYTRNRALFRFDPTEVIAQGSRIKNVELILEVTRQPDETPANSAFTLHRLLVPWGEGSKTNSPGTPGQGQPATLGEATWNHRFALTTNTWSVPGAAAPNDYVADVSALAFVQGTYDSPYVFGPTSRLISDVQSWVNEPDSNFGWILVCQNEEANFSARRFGSWESGIDSPRLFIEYVPPPRIDAFGREGNQVQFTFMTEPNESYQVEFRNSFATNQNWTLLTNVNGSGTTVSITDGVQESGRFYRVLIPY